MFTDHGTFIIGFSIAKHHLAVAPERVVIQHFLMKLYRLAMITPKSWYVSGGKDRSTSH